MKTKSIKQEILLVTGTTFAEKEWCEKDKEGNNHYFTRDQQLENACWNGLLRELLPEIFENIPANKNLFMWQLQVYDSCLEMELGEKPEKFEKAFSINPYNLLEREGSMN